MRKVLFLVDKYSIGGLHTIAEKIIESFQSDKIIIDVIYLRSTGSLNISRHELDKTIHLKSSKYSIIPVFKILSIIKKNKYSIIHANGDKSSYFLSIIKLFNPEIFVIHHEHHTIMQEKIFYELYLMLFGKIIDRFIAVSQSVKDKLIEKSKIKPEKINIINNFYTIDNVYFPEKKMNHPKTITLGFIGRLEKVKGCDELLKLFKKLSEKNNCRLIVAGDGNQRAELEKYSKENSIDDRVEFLGFINSKEKNDFYRMIDLLVIPSLSETFSIALADAYAAGIPVLTNNIQVFKELIEEGINGYRFELNNFEDFEEKYNLILKKYEIISNENKQKSKKYTPEVFLEKLEKLYITL